MTARRSTARKAAAKKRSTSAGKAKAKPAGIGRSAITGKFMSVGAAKAHKKTAIIEGAKRKRGGDTGVVGARSPVLLRLRRKARR